MKKLELGLIGYQMNKNCIMLGTHLNPMTIILINSSRVSVGIRQILVCSNLMNSSSSVLSFH